MARYGVCANDALVEEAASEVLQAGGSALQAALTGFFVAAGTEAGVLFGPMSLLVGGVGSGVFAYDGRSRQPGREVKRPRGFLAEEEIPQAALVAVPATVSAAALAVAFHPGTTLLSCVRPGVKAAKTAGALGRAELLEHIATLGATALGEASIKKSFLVQFGAVEQGSISAADLIAPEALNTRATERSGAWELPWHLSKAEGCQPEFKGHSVIAADARGLLVALCYEPIVSGPTLSPFQVTVPATAQPVLRGVPRLTPGSPLPFLGRLMIEQDSSGRLIGARSISTGREPPLGLVRNPETREVTPLQRAEKFLELGAPRAAEGS